MNREAELSKPAAFIAGGASDVACVVSARSKKKDGGVDMSGDKESSMRGPRVYSNARSAD